MKKNVAFTHISFAVVPFELMVQIPVQLLLELEANRLDQNLIELYLHTQANIQQL